MGRSVFMADAVVIEHRNLTAGIAVRERGGYRFYSSDALFFPIDTRKFRRLSEIEAEVRRVAEECRRRSAALAGGLAAQHP
jgi:hypothetical protein